MIYIKKLPKRKKREYISEKRALRQKYYNSKEWRKLRDGYFMCNPLCERCAELGITKAGEDVHHILSFIQFEDEDTIREYMYDPDNLLTLCKDCHSYIHSHKKEEELYRIYYERKRDKI